MSGSRYPPFLSQISQKTTRQNFKVNVFSEGVIFILLENICTIKFCRVIFEKFDLQQVGTVQNGKNYCFHVYFIYLLVVGPAFHCEF